MRNSDPHHAEKTPPRRPLYGSAWLALFELLRKEWAQFGTPSALSRGDSVSHRP